MGSDGEGVMIGCDMMVWVVIERVCYDRVCEIGYVIYVLVPSCDSIILPTAL